MKFVTPREEKEVEIGGAVWKYRPLTGGERDRIIDKHTTVRPDGTVKQDMVAALEEMWSLMITEVPEELRREFKKYYGREWKGSKEDFKLLTGEVRDELITKIPINLGGDAAKN